jgi:phosphoribosylformylglycinamidine cyclo-ligase
VIPEGLSARLRLGSWNVPRLFRTLQEMGSVSDTEMRRTFNMGVGFVVVVARDSAKHATQLLEQAGETVIALGKVVRGEEPVVVEGLA